MSLQGQLTQLGILADYGNGGIEFTAPVSFRGAVAAALGLGQIFYLDPANGSDNNNGLTPQLAKTTLDGVNGAFAQCTAGKNDVIVQIGDGSTAATERLDAAFTWNKRATHYVGIASPSIFSQRARIAPTGTTTAFANFFTISVDGCLFENIQWFHGFNTGVASAIALTITGGRNVFRNCHIAGMGDAESGADAGSRCIKFNGSGAGENVFENCAIGVDTVDRSAANANLEFAGGAPRNIFKGCVFPIRATAATPLAVKVAAAAGSDRFQHFIDCIFENHNTTMSALSTLAASMGGFHLYKNCTLVKISEYGTDATSLAQIYVDGGTPAAGSTGIAVNPS